MPRTVPISLLRQVVYPKGRRLPHLERLVFPEAVDAVPRKMAPSYVTHGPVLLPAGLPDPGRNLNKTIFGNLPLTEYRFFAGRDNEDSAVARCRYCFTTLYGQDRWEQHRKLNPCPERLGEVYKAMRAEKRCAVCSKATTFLKWGCPLCSASCIREFMFSFPTNMCEYVTLEKQKNYA